MDNVGFKPENVKIIRKANTGKPTGAAFVECKTVEDARHAVKHLNGRYIKGCS